MTRRLVVVGILLIVAVALVTIWSGGLMHWIWAPPPSIVLITIDTLRPERLSAYGYTGHRTPAIDSLARDGVLFENAVCDIPWTTGSMASVMTGTYGVKHGLHFPSQRLAASFATLAEMLRTRGYHTRAVVGSFPVASLYGLNQGFESYDEEFTTSVVDPGRRAVQKVPNPTKVDPDELANWATEKFLNDAFRSDAEVTERALKSLTSHPQEPMFLWVHYFGPHERLYASDGSHAAQELRIVSQYDADVAATDRAIEALVAGIDHLELKNNLAFVLHADHGQSLGEHQFVGHGNDLYDASIRIPLIVRLRTGGVAGRRVGELVRNVDIMPTILDLAGVAAPPQLDGRSLVPALRGEALSQVHAYVETYTPTLLLWPLDVPELGATLGPVVRYAIRTARWKFVESRGEAPCEKGDDPFRDPRPGVGWQLRNAVGLAEEACNGRRVDELYDLSADPEESRNLMAQRSDVAKDLRGEVAEAIGHQTHAERLELRQSEKERLRSLGYNPGSE